VHHSIKARLKRTLFRPYHVNILANSRQFTREFARSLCSRGSSSWKKGRRRRDGSAAFTHPGIQREIGASGQILASLRLAENGRRKGRIARWGERKKVLVWTNLESVFFRPWKDRMHSYTCYHPVSRLVHTEKFSLARTTSSSIFFFFFFCTAYKLFSILFLSIREKRVERLGDDFQSRL